MSESLAKLDLVTEFECEHCAAKVQLPEPVLIATRICYGCWFDRSAYSG